jgi:hypothetical protein
MATATAVKAPLESSPEDGIFYQKTYKNPKGEFTLVLDDYELREHAKYGMSISLRFKIADEGEFQGQGVSLTLWPSPKTKKLEPTYGAKPNNFARVQIALMGRKLKEGEPINFKSLLASGATMRAFVKEDVKEDGSRWPKIDVETMEHVA